jgi:hypothetical protein
MHLKVFLKLKKPLDPFFWAKKPKKNQKIQKNHKKNTGLGLKKTRVFLQPCLHELADHPVGCGAEQHLRVPATVLHPPHLAHLTHTYI